jgi:DNA-directed RNA polymerase subunit H (RpoH/RPB5)
MAAAASAAGAAPEPAAAPAPRRKIAHLTMSHDAHMYLKARNVLLEILEMRGFDVSPLTAESPDEISALSDDLGKYYMTVSNEEGRRCRVILAKTPQKANKEISSHILDGHPDKLNTDGSDEVLVVVFGPLSDSATRDLTQYGRRNNLQIDGIQVNNLLFNPFRHELVPEYTPVQLDSEEEKNILDSIAIRKKRQLPVIQSSDIIARLLGLRKEQLVIVHNKGPGGGNRFVRVCLDG